MSNPIKDLIDEKAFDHSWMSVIKLTDSDLEKMIPVKTINGQVVVGNITPELEQLIVEKSFDQVWHLSIKNAVRLMPGTKFSDIKCAQFVRQIGDSFHWVDRDTSNIVITKIK